MNGETHLTLTIRASVDNRSDAPCSNILFVDIVGEALVVRVMSCFRIQRCRKSKSGEESGEDHKDAMDAHDIGQYDYDGQQDG